MGYRACLIIIGTTAMYKNRQGRSSFQREYETAGPIRVTYCDLLRPFCDRITAFCMVVLLQGGDNPSAFIWSLAYAVRGTLGEPIAKPALVGVCVSAI